MSSSSIEAVGQFKAYARFVSVDAAKNRYRYYSLTWQPGLWGDGALTRCWGRIGTKGRSVETIYKDRACAQALVEKIVKRRLQHGYQVVDAR